MSGFQAYNTYGNIVVDSEQKGTVISSLIPQGNVEVTGYLIPTPFGDGRSLGYMVSDILFQPGLLWCRFTRDSYCFPGAELFEPNSVQFMRTSVNGTVQSGYLDVFNGQGTLIWSAASAGSMPRVFDHLVIPQGYNLQGQVISKNLGWSPWFYCQVYRVTYRKAQRQWDFLACLDIPMAISKLLMPHSIKITTHKVLTNNY